MKATFKNSILLIAFILISNAVQANSFNLFHNNSIIARVFYKVEAEYQEKHIPVCTNILQVEIDRVKNEVEIPRIIEKEANETVFINTNNSLENYGEDITIRTLIASMQLQEKEVKEKFEFNTMVYYQEWQNEKLAKFNSFDISNVSVTEKEVLDPLFIPTSMITLAK